MPYRREGKGKTIGQIPMFDCLIDRPQHFDTVGHPPAARFIHYLLLIAGAYPCYQQLEIIARQQARQDVEILFLHDSPYCENKRSTGHHCRLHKFALIYITSIIDHIYIFPPYIYVGK